LENFHLKGKAKSKVEEKASEKRPIPSSKEGAGAEKKGCKS